MTTADEYLDLVNEKDEVIGKMLRSEVYAKDLSNFRVVNAFLVHPQGKLWIPRRSASKRLFPLCLDMSAAGHVESGETYEEAFYREVWEETRIDPTKKPWTFLGHLTPHEHGVSAFMNIYEIQIAEAPEFNRDDFVEYYWLTPLELSERLERGDKAKGDLLKLVQRFYS